MPKVAPAAASPILDAITPLSELKSDGFSVPHYNSSATLSLYPGEPFPKTQGSGAFVALAQSLIRPGEWKSVLRFWNAVFPCNFSADVKDGDEVYWDQDNEVVSLGADVTNGFLLGYATYSADPGETVTAAADDRVVVATSASTKVQVVCATHATTLKGTASALSEPMSVSSTSKKKSV